MPSKAILDEIDKKVDPKKMEETLMQEGTAKFSDPQHGVAEVDWGEEGGAGGEVGGDEESRAGLKTWLRVQHEFVST